MLKKNALLLFSAVVFCASAAVAEIPDLDLTTAVTATPGCVLYNAIDGSGDPFSQAHMPNGTIVNGTITLHLVNYLNQPLPGRPAEDFWLDTSAAGLVYPALGTIADGPTDAGGNTVWANPLNAGGCSVGETIIAKVQGDPLNQAGILMEFVSADLNGDLAVNLSDLSLFAAAYTVTYSACADLFFDGVINLSDLSRFAAAYL